MQAALECVAAVDMHEEEGEPIITKHGGPEAPEFGTDDDAEQEMKIKAYEKAVRAFVSEKVRLALTLSKEEIE